MGKLSGNVLKIIAMVSMLIDHIGMYFFPQVDILRIIGRLSYPIFAFMIAEGCKHTKNKLRYFLMIFILAIIVQVVYYIGERELFMCVLVSFSLSIPMVYTVGFLKSVIFEEKNARRVALSILFLVLSVGATIGVNLVLEVDYGIMGCFLPVLASLLHAPKEGMEKLKKYDTIWGNVLIFSIGCLALALIKGGIQIFSLLSIPLLLLYSGKRGKYNIKYLFYLFYPLHLAILEGISHLV